MQTSTMVSWFANRLKVSIYVCLIWSFYIFSMVLFQHFGSRSKTIEECAERITMYERERFICIVRDRAFPNPSVVNDKMNRSVTEVTSDDWYIKKSEDIRSHITNRRVKEFEISSHNQSSEPIKSINDSTTKSEDLDSSWNRCVIDQPLRHNPKAFNITIDKRMLIKIYDYDVFYSNVTSKEPSRLDLPLDPEDSSCVVFYVSLCQDCLLDVSTPNGEYYNFGKSTGGWQTQQIDLSAGGHYVYVTRRKGNQNRNGEWMIHITQCSELPNDKRRCSFLDDERKGRTDETLNCGAGKIGKDCSLKCEDIFGEENKYCQHRMICLNQSCSCAWGSKGDFCDEECEDGRWGPDCRNTCAENNCELCDKFTGTCMADDSDSGIFDNK